jgi:hypothetical protein
MRLHPDFVDLLAEFAAAEVRYLVIGGYAVGFHDRPRTTKDLDVLLDPSAENVERAAAALARFGAPPSVVEDLRQAAADEIVWMGRPPVRIDLLKEAPGISFRSAYERRVTASWGGIDVEIVSLDDLISAKRAAGRDQDQLDVKNLERVRRNR